MKALQFKQGKIVVAMYAADDALRFSYQWMQLTPFSDYDELLVWLTSDETIAPDFTINAFADGTGPYHDHVNLALVTQLSIEKRGTRYMGTFSSESGNFLGREFFGANELPGVLTVFRSQFFLQQYNDQ